MDVPSAEEIYRSDLTARLDALRGQAAMPTAWASLGYCTTRLGRAPRRRAPVRTALAQDKERTVHGKHHHHHHHLSQGTVSLEDARRVTAAAEDCAREIGQPQNIAVVDAGGNLVSHVRMDGA